MTGNAADCAGAGDGEVAGALLAWYAACGRDLPWRRTSDPYHILVAEVMLQQTQVDRVLPKYREFLAAFPTVQDLAAAPAAEVIRRWAPLGYNLRAVRLHGAARAVVERWDGRFPDSVEELQRLPGIGPYTAGAIACFAFGRPAAFLDTNLRRVLGRCLCGIPFPSPADDAVILEAARRALPDSAYSWNQGLMDLGAMVCLRRKPACDGCPLSTWCLARPALDNGRDAAGGLRAAEPRSPYRVQGAFAGSRRFYRGRVVSALRDLPPGARTTLAALAAKLPPPPLPSDPGWLPGLINDLARDGLVRVAGRDQPPAEWQVTLP